MTDGWFVGGISPFKGGPAQKMKTCGVRWSACTIRLQEDIILNRIFYL